VTASYSGAIRIELNASFRQREEPDIQWKAAAFVRWHEPDDARVGLASFIVGWALRDSIGISFARMGADLVVVPPATLVNITSSLLTVQPTDQTLPVDLGEQIAGILGIARVAPQRIVPALVEGPSLSLRIPSAPFDGAAGLRRRTGQRSQGSVTST
jgi:hypothetical protein